MAPRVFVFDPALRSGALIITHMRGHGLRAENPVRLAAL